jgi:hypothetical protein
VTVTQKGLKLTFKVTAVKNIPKASVPCVMVYAGAHNSPGRDGYAVGCFDPKAVTTSDGGSQPLKRKVKGKTVTYTLDPAAIGSPGRFRWQATVGADGKTWGQGAQQEAADVRRLQRGRQRRWRSERPRRGERGAEREEPRRHLRAGSRAQPLSARPRRSFAVGSVPWPATPKPAQ